MNDVTPKSELNIRDIARLSGVSRSTVSRVLNHAPNVNEETRQRVLKVIEEHNYRPNVAARTLVTQRSNVLGIYIPYLVDELFTDPYFAVLIQGITRCANENNYDVMLWLQEQDNVEHLHSRVMDSRMADGLILASTPKHDLLPLTLLERGRTFVMNGHPWHDAERMNYVDSTNRQGAQQAVEHLARLGRRRIGTITGRLELGSGMDRFIGYRQALQRLNREVDENLIVEGDFTEAGGYAGMRRLLVYKPDAVFVASDHMAMGALRAIREAGMRVPDDIAIVGFDDMPFATLATPPLTTIRQSVLRIGQLATEGLIGLLQGTITPPYQVSLPTQLVIRESCGFPA